MTKISPSLCNMNSSKLHTACWSGALILAVTALPCVSQSLWKEGTSKTMYADKRASRVGDLITIVVQENTTASKNNATSTSKKASMDAAISSFFYSPGASGLLTKGGQLPALKYASANNFDGGGSIKNSEQIVAQVTVQVIDVLPNGNMVVEGTRETAFSGEKQKIVLHGIVRAEDVASNNTVFSYNVADAKIQIVGRGTIADSQRKGWFTKIWDKITPF
jgi:flagellar L-ring protein precursor FlgH